MPAAQNKTIATEASVKTFLDSVDNETRRQDSFVLLELMTRVTGKAANMWGPAIIGFGSYHYRYESGREGDMLRVGFSPRKSNLAIYLTAADSKYEALLAKLGKHKTGVSCLYVNKLSDINMNVLATMVENSWRESLKKHGAEN